MRVSPERRKTVTALPSGRWLGILAATLALNVAGGTSAQTVSALVEPQTQMQAPAKSIKPMTPQRLAWLKGRCSQLVAFFDYYGVSRGENTDGARNFTRIGAAIECERTHYRNGIDTMAALLVRKAFEVPKPGAPAVEPEDVEAPDITNPTRPWWW
jgi:hypothetical protein